MFHKKTVAAHLAERTKGRQTITFEGAHLRAFHPKHSSLSAWIYNATERKTHASKQASEESLAGKFRPPQQAPHSAVRRSHVSEPQQSLSGEVH